MSIVQDRTEEGWLIRVDGDVDLASAPALEDALEKAGEDPVRVDLSGVTFMDSSGLRVLLAASKRAKERGHHLTLASPAGPVRRLLEITGLDKELAVSDDQG
jgi:anti-sigma B factor antagonist